MRRILRCIFATMLACTMGVVPFAVAAENEVLDAEISPYAFGTYDGTMEITLTIPEYKSTLGYTVPKWTCPIGIKYRINYNLNTGEITSVTYLSTVITPGLAMSPTEQGRLVSLNFESVKMDIINSGNAISCTYSATADLLYIQTPGVPIHQESVSCSVRGSGVETPPRP